MPASSEIAPMWRSKPSASELWGNRATMVTNVAKPPSAQLVHAGGFQSRPKSDLLHDFTMASSSTPRIRRNGFLSTWRLRSGLRLNLNEEPRPQRRGRIQEAICGLGWIYRGQ